MSGVLLLLQTVHQNVHQTGYTLAKKNFSQPKIYSGGVDITLWNELSKEEQNNAISKDWYIYYKFMDVTTGKLKLCYFPKTRSCRNNYYPSLIVQLFLI
jgi:hypothetical protein